MMKEQILSPEQFFGFQMGADRKLARWDKIVEYYKQIGKSPNVKVIELGKSTMGNPFILVIISSPENLKNLDKIREISWLLSHPKSLSEKDVDKLVTNGKTVISMTMSLHSSEVGGTQMAPELVYDLATSDDVQIQNIRQNTVFLLFPCGNPDGNIMVVDWYNKYLGTEYEGTPLPSIYHKYTGHDNSRDVFHLTQIESKLIGRVLFKEWYPQAHIGFHHAGSYGCRYNIPPLMDPLDEQVDPLVWVEQRLYGAAMLVELEAAGKTGVGTQCGWLGSMASSWPYVPLLHGITSMLTESANIELATPIYIHYQQLVQSMRGRPEYRTQTSFPHPWPGGWWRLRDIVEQMKISAIAALKCAASYRERILRNMYTKAKRQIELGKFKPPYAFIVSPEQHDILTAHKLLKILRAGDVEVHRAVEKFKVDGTIYPKGTYVIFTAQTCRPYILVALKRTFYHVGPWSKEPDGTPLPPGDTTTYTLAEFMNVEIMEVSKPIKGNFELCDHIQLPIGRVEESEHGYLIDGRLNESFAIINSIQKKGIEVYRVMEPVRDLPVGAFYIPTEKGIAMELTKYAESHHIVFHAAASADFKKRPVKPLKIGLYRRYRGGSMDEGWNRWIYEQYGFNYKTLWDADIKEGKLNDKYDVIILPNDNKAFLLGEGLEEYYRNSWRGQAPRYPPEYQSGIGEDGVKKLREFVEAGGTLVTLCEASNFAIEEFKLPFNNVVKDINPKEFFCPGSTLKVNIDLAHPLAYGVAEDCLILFWRNFPVFEIQKGTNNEDYKAVVSYPEDRILQSGWLIGEKYLSKKAALIEAKLGKGRIVLFGFSPLFRAETDATFKFLFNCLLG